MLKKKRPDDKAPTSASKTDVKCSTCRNPVDSTGWCEHCHQYPGNVSPRRLGSCGHPVDVSGWCHTHREFKASRLEFSDGHWLDTGRTDKLVPRAENQRRMRFLVEAMARGDKASLLKFAKQRAKAEPGIGWEQAIGELEASTDAVPF